MKILEYFSLPLLTKELIEQAQYKRTYVLRATYAVVLYSFTLWQYYELTGGASSTGIDNFGKGRIFFEGILALQKWAILLLLPAITCSAVSLEKEKDTLALLLLTKLNPATIVLEKLLSRLFAMGTYQLLSLPLFAIVYGIGGVEIDDVICGVLFLFALTLVVGSLSILCSTWYRTTSESFVMSYLGTIFVSPLFPISIVTVVHGPRVSKYLEMGAFFILASGGAITLMAVASRALVPRAFIPARNLLLELFQKADRFFNELNRSTTGGIVLVSDKDPLPLFEPIAWRETRKRSLGTFRYQFRVLMLLLSPLIVAIAAVMTDGRTDFSSPFHGFPVFFWFVSVICLVTHSTGVIPSERIRQSLDVLLVSPLNPGEIVREKLSGVRRLIKILTVPFAVLILFQMIWTGYVMSGAIARRPTDFWAEVVTATMSVLLYMPLIKWVGFQCGLRFRSQMHAVLATFANLVAICIIPPALAHLAHDQLLNVSLTWLSPLRVIFATMPIGMSFSIPELAQTAYGYQYIWLGIGLNFVVYAFVCGWLRQNAYRNFSRIVGRTEPDGRIPEASTHQDSQPAINELDSGLPATESEQRSFGTDGLDTVG